jgi:hypothetical protein
MFQSIKYIRALGYNAATKQYEYEYELIDSDFNCIIQQTHGARVLGPRDVIKEYSKRKLNVATNLVRYFLFNEKKWGYSIAEQMEWAEAARPLFTPEIEADLTKYLALL